jgi:endogenous inhibitor of DNA gyrase (YacG/DUF329 family)
MTARQCPACGARQCPICGALVPALDGRGRPRIYCCDRCRWRAGHAAARARRRDAEPMTNEQLLDYLAGLPDPLDVLA